MGISGANLNSRLSAGQSTQVQVNRKAIVQTVFKEFYELELELDSFAMRPAPESRKPIVINDLEDFETLAFGAKADGSIVDPTSLERGRLVEAEVELDTDDSFRMRAVISAVMGMAESGLLDEAMNSTLPQVEAVHRVMEELLAGLVPIRGRVVDYEVVDIEGREWIMHRSLLNQIAETHAPSIPSGRQLSWPTYSNRWSLLLPHS